MPWHVECDYTWCYWPRSWHLVAPSFNIRGTTQILETPMSTYRWAIINGSMLTTETSEGWFLQGRMAGGLVRTRLAMIQSPHQMFRVNLCTLICLSNLSCGGLLHVVLGARLLHRGGARCLPQSCPWAPAGGSSWPGPSGSCNGGHYHFLELSIKHNKTKYFVLHRFDYALKIRQLSYCVRIEWRIHFSNITITRTRTEPLPELLAEPKTPFSGSILLLAIQRTENDREIFQENAKWCVWGGSKLRQAE